VRWHENGASGKAFLLRGRSGGHRKKTAKLLTPPIRQL
jgi:hypothetical protein